VPNRLPIPLSERSATEAIFNVLYHEGDMDLQK